VSDQPDASSDQNKPAVEQSSVVENRSGGVDVQASRVNVTGDVVGHDVNKVTYVGMSPEAVRRLVLTVGVLVFVTAACFFTGGIFVGRNVIAALDRGVNSDPQFGQQVADALAQIDNLPAGQKFSIVMTESQLSSYLRHFLGPQIGLSDARARLLDNGQIMFYGQWSGLANLPILAVVSMQPSADRLFQVQSAAVRIVSIQNSDFGWVALPASFLQPLANQIGRDFSDGINLIAVTPSSGPGSSVSIEAVKP
jgi:hypothetical protein